MNQEIQKNVNVNKELATSKVTNNILQSMDDIERAAKAMAASGFFSDIKQLSQAIVKILAGKEMGFGAFNSMTGISIIQGKPTVGSNLMASAVKRSGRYDYRVTKLSNEECEIEFFEYNKSVGISNFTIKDATNAGLSSKDNWKKYPKNMLFNRAISNGVRLYCPDVLGGAPVYTPEELGVEVDDEGNILEGKCEQVTQPKTAIHEMDEGKKCPTPSLDTSELHKQLPKFYDTNYPLEISKARDLIELKDIYDRAVEEGYIKEVAPLCTSRKLILEKEFSASKKSN